MDKLKTVLESLGPVSGIGSEKIRRVLVFGSKGGEVWGIKGLSSLIAYGEIVQSIYQSKNINSHYSERDVEKKINEALMEIDLDTNQKTNHFKNSVFKKLPLGPIENFQIWRNVYGVKFEGHKKLGGFLFQKSKNMEKVFPTGFKRVFKKEEMFGENVVRVEVSCVSDSRAMELADELFRKLEMLFACLLGRASSGHAVRILRPSPANKVSFSRMSQSGLPGMGSSNHDVEHGLVDLKSDFFKDPGLPRLFTLVSKSNHSPVEKRIEKAIDWIGRGTTSRTDAEAIVCYCTALETLLIREKGTIISPSIVASLSEYCTFLLAGGLGQRKKIVKLVKSIYGERSAVTHGGRTEVKREFLSAARSIAFDLVLELSRLSSKGLLDDMSVFDYVENKKYG